MLFSRKRREKLIQLHLLCIQVHSFILVIITSLSLSLSPPIAAARNRRIFKQVIYSKVEDLFSMLFIFKREHIMLSVKQCSESL
ncbi:hypothetical protein L1887_23132 [Cichorium endivia]|nr:hypothetical protein L1887_23132 [Cichorium endivia]